MLFGIEAVTGMSLAMVVPGKGNARAWIAERLADWIDELGSPKVTVKADGEAAITALINEVRRRRKIGSTTLREAPEEGEKQSNHLAEGAVGLLKGMIRTLKASAEERLKDTMDPKHPLMPWLVEQASHLRNRYQVGPDGRTPVERQRGRAIDSNVFELGEKVMYTPLKTKGHEEERPRQGIYLGMYKLTGQSIVGTPQGVARCRTVKTMPESMRWDAAAARAIHGTPWDTDASGGERISIQVDMSAPAARAPETPRATVERRRLKIDPWMIETYGKTVGCRGCKALGKEGERAAHEEICRTRIEAKLAETPEGQAKLDRVKRRMDEAIAEKVQRRSEEDRRYVGKRFMLEGLLQREDLNGKMVTVESRSSDGTRWRAIVDGTTRCCRARARL